LRFTQTPKTNYPLKSKLRRQNAWLFVCFSKNESQTLEHKTKQLENKPQHKTYNILRITSMYHVWEQLDNFMVNQNAFDANLSYLSWFFSRAFFMFTSYVGGIIASGL
jgi:sensor domain CHASE-containing protein